MGQPESLNHAAVKSIVFLPVTRKNKMCSVHHPSVTQPLELTIKTAIKGKTMSTVVYMET